MGRSVTLGGACWALSVTGNKGGRLISLERRGKLGGRGSGARIIRSTAASHARWRATAGSRRRSNETAGRGSGGRITSSSAAVHPRWRSKSRRPPSRHQYRRPRQRRHEAPPPNGASQGVSAGGRRPDVIAGGRRTGARIARPADVACATDMAITGGGRRFPIYCGRRRCLTLMSDNPATSLLNDHFMENGGRLPGKQHVLNCFKAARVQKNVEPRGQDPVKPVEFLRIVGEVSVAAAKWRSAATGVTSALRSLRGDSRLVELRNGS